MAVLAGGQVADPALGIPAQGGDSYFLQRFALRSYTTRDQVGAMKFALEHQNPLVCGAVSGTTPTLPADKFEAISLDNPNVLLWAFKPYEDGPGSSVTVRLWNLSETPQAVHVQLRPETVALARSVSHIETDEGPAQVTTEGLFTTLPRQGLQTFRLVPRKLAHPQ
jgi:alpha-mannosidase